ncbi:MAG: hypothetical protein GC154_12150 [bacterium]|nr:hypothetical protein [bacterium]
MNKRIQLPLILFVCAAATLVFSCGGPEERDRPVSPVQIPIEPIEATPTPEMVLPPTPTPTPTPAPQTWENGWSVWNLEAVRGSGLAQRAKEFGATHIQIGGQALRVIEDLIFDAGRQEAVRDLAQQAEALGLKTLVWSRELNLGQGLFRFDPTDPYYAARQAAYRNVFQLIPELDGVVLNFADSPTKPWLVEPPLGVDAPAPAERTRFIIDMVYRVVARDFGKSVWIRVGDEPITEIEVIAEAVRRMNTPELGVIVSHSGWMNAQKEQLDWLLRSFSTQPVILEADAAESRLAGPRAIVSLAPQLSDHRSAWMNPAVKGVCGLVDGGGELVFGSPNEVNLNLLSGLAQGPNFRPGDAVEDWIVKRYGFQPGTREGSLLKSIYAKSWLVSKKICAVLMDTPFSFQWAVSGENAPQFDKQKLQFIEKDTLVELAQESYEAQTLLQNALNDLRQSPDIGSSQAFWDWEKRISDEYQLATLIMYAKQCYWGFQYWSRTHDEQEALLLEGHLRRLETIANSLQGSWSWNGETVDAQSVALFIQSIRSQFPRVLFGAQERKWNHIYEVSLRQISSTGFEISWKTEQPATGRCFVSNSYNTFGSALNAAMTPSTEHHAVLDGLQPGAQYWVKIEMKDLGGDTVRSGVFSIQLEAPDSV